MTKLKAGLFWGAIAGLIDITPMLIMKLPLPADFSAFSMWLTIGFFIATTNIPLKGAAKGVAIAILAVIPLVFIIGAGNPADLIPVCVMTLILGSILGEMIERD